jgi:hypothetical protein
MHVELQASRHVDIGACGIFVNRITSRDVEQCRASVDSPCVTSNL